MMYRAYGSTNVCSWLFVSNGVVYRSALVNFSQCGSSLSTMLGLVGFA